MKILLIFILIKSLIRNFVSPHFSQFKIFVKIKNHYHLSIPSIFSSKKLILIEVVKVINECMEISKFM